MKEEIIWDDIDCVAVIEKSEYSFKFSIYEIIGHLADKNGKYTVPMYELKGSTSSEHTESLDNAQTLIKGFIKWDACSHLTFGDENGYIHLCGGRIWFNLMEAIKRIWDIACKTLPQEHSKDMFDLHLFSVHNSPHKINR